MHQKKWSATVNHDLSNKLFSKHSCMIRLYGTRYWQQNLVLLDIHFLIAAASSLSSAKLILEPAHSKINHWINSWSLWLSSSSYDKLQMLKQKP